MRPETQWQLENQNISCEGSFNSFLTVLTLSTVFDVLSRFGLCNFFPVVAKRTAEHARGNTVMGTTEEWCSRDDIALYVRSTQCHVLLQEYTRLNHYP